MLRIRRQDSRSRTTRDDDGSSDSDAPEGSERQPPGADSAGASADDRQPHPVLQIVPELVVLAFCAVLFWQTAGFRSTGQGPGPAFFPRLLIGLLAVAMVVRVIQQLREIRRTSVTVAAHTGADAQSSPDAPPEPQWLEEGAEVEQAAEPSRIRLLQAIAMAVGYVVATLYLGWIIATFCLVVVFLYMAGKRKLLLTVPLAAVLSLVCTYVFVSLVYIPLPTGVGFFDTISVQLLELIGAY